MKTTISHLAAGLMLLAALGCEGEAAREADEKKPAENKRVEVGKNVVLEVVGDKRRVLVNAEVCKTMGPLELLLCKAGTKEHEAVFAAAVDGRDIHKALNLAGAEEGTTVQWKPRYKPATGQVIQVWVRYENKDGKLVTTKAQQFVRNIKTQKALDIDWVFAGSKLIPDPRDKKKPPLYLANDGDLISISNFDTSMLDLPIKSTADDDDLDFEAFTENIPAEKTKVTIVLEPTAEKVERKK